MVMGREAGDTAGTYVVAESSVELMVTASRALHFIYLPISVTDRQNGGVLR